MPIVELGKPSSDSALIASVHVIDAGLESLPCSSPKCCSGFPIIVPHLAPLLQHVGYTLICFIRGPFSPAKVKHHLTQMSSKR